MKNFKKIKISFFLLTLIGVFSFLIGCEKDSKTTKKSKQVESTSITLAGSTSVTPYAEKITQAFQTKNKDVVIDVQGLGSTAGVKAVNENTAEIGMVSRELTDKEKELGLKEHLIALEGIAVITHPKNNIENLDIKTVRKIFKGEIKNWKEVGGIDQPIIVISREAGSGTRGAFDELVELEEKKKDKNISIVSEDAQIADGNGSVKQNVSGKESAIGYISLGYLDDSINAISIDGVEPTVENIKLKKYKISRPFLLLTKGEVTSKVSDYLNFVMSGNGQEIIKKEGAVPVK